MAPFYSLSDSARLLTFAAAQACRIVSDMGLSYSQLQYIHVVCYLQPLTQQQWIQKLPSPLTRTAMQSKPPITTQRPDGLSSILGLIVHQQKHVSENSKCKKAVAINSIGDFISLGFSLFVTIKKVHFMFFDR